jgi:NADPH-dependent glutamate synthase beta subunit-like oxidoreductase
VAADYKGDIHDRLPKKAAAKNGKRVACVGAGPASLTVARDLTPLGLPRHRLRLRPARGGMIRSQIPKFRLPESVIDEEVGIHPRLGVDFRAGHRIDSMKRSWARASTRCSSAPARRAAATSRFPEGGKPPANIHIGIDWLSSVAFGHITKIGRRVIVLGGGNTAMDCCRSSRRLGGDDVKVIVRSGFEEMKASPWEKEDAMHEGIPILNYLVPKAFLHDGAAPHRHGFREGEGDLRRARPAQARAHRRARPGLRSATTC